ncbi:pyridoxal phosphate-dependent aminotransferase [Candidatus Micrarchaeota archaeon]|nr:pyridoxal phosphate-dependent aminotransferase [Candidatus Micrarchaeota archaeon]
MNLASRMQNIGTETAFEVGARVAALERDGKKIYKFHIGQPDFPTPDYIKDGARDALDANQTGYTEARGTYAVREACARYGSRLRGVDFTPEQTVVAPGAKPILFGAAFTLLEAGDEAIVPDPGFPIYDSAVRVMGAKSVPLPLLEEKAFNFELDTLQESVTSKTKLLFLNTPQNPTGGVLTDDVLKGVRDLAVDHDFTVLADEVYNSTVYDRPFRSIITYEGMRERTIILDGHSKTYSMPGWRLGYAFMPEDLAKAMTTLAINIYSCPSSIVQEAGRVAVDGPQDEVRAMVAEFKKRREYMVSRLNAIDGVSCVKPQGAFYAFPNVKPVLAKMNWKSNDLERYLLSQGVAVLSGSAFGACGEGYIRFSYATAMSEIEAGMERFEQALDGLKNVQKATA